MALEVPSNRVNSIGSTEMVGMLKHHMNTESMKQRVEPESIRVWKKNVAAETRKEAREIQSEFRLERADALSRTVSIVAQGGSTQSSGCAEEA